MPKKNKAKEKAREAYLEKRKLEREAAAAAKGDQASPRSPPRFTKSRVMSNFFAQQGAAADVEPELREAPLTAAAAGGATPLEQPLSEVSLKGEPEKVGVRFRESALNISNDLHEMRKFQQPPRASSTAGTRGPPASRGTPTSSKATLGTTVRPSHITPTHYNLYNLKLITTY